MAETKHWELTGPKAEECAQTYKAEQKRLNAMSKWFKKNLPDWGERDKYRIGISPSGLSSIEYWGEIPVGFKRDRRGMLSPKVATPEGKAVAKGWKGFSQANWIPLCESLGVKYAQFGPGLVLLYVQFEVVGKRVFFETFDNVKNADVKPVKLWEYEKAKEEAKQ